MNGCPILLLGEGHQLNSQAQLQAAKKRHAGVRRPEVEAFEHEIRRFQLGNLKGWTPRKVQKIDQSTGFSGLPPSSNTRPLWVRLGQNSVIAMIC